MKTEKSVSEPSMEEILASIRQIISSDSQDEKKSFTPLNEHNDILDLINPLPEENQKTMSSTEEKCQKHQNEGSGGCHQVSPPERFLEDSLVSQKTMSEAAQTFSSLHTLAQKSSRSHDDYRGQNLETLVRESLKPLLKEWLDSNLPTLVRWIVAEQVEKIIRQGNIAQPDSVSREGESNSRY